MPLNQSLRADIIMHVNEVFFPKEVDETVMDSLRQLFMDYIASSYGSMHPFVQPTVSPRWLFLTPMDGILDPICLRVPQFDEGFSVPFVKLTPELAPLENRGGFFGSSYNKERNEKLSRIVLEMCPIPGFADTAEALYSFRRDSLKLKCFLSTELRKSATTESFLKKFPEMKPLMSPWVKDEILDLPMAADIDMGSITFDAVGA